MKLENYEVHLPSYSIGNAIYDKIGPVCESYGRTVLIIGGKKALAAALDKIKEAVSHTALEIIGVELYGNDCTYETVDIIRFLFLLKIGIVCIFVKKYTYLNIIRNTINTLPYMFDIAIIARTSIHDAGINIQSFVLSVIARFFTKLSKCFL